jgi:YVTN family beta-propeller protein
MNTMPPGVSSKWTTRQRTSRIYCCLLPPIVSAALSAPAPVRAVVCQYVVDRPAGTVHVTDPQSGSITATFRVGDWPLQVAVNPDASRLYIVAYDRTRSGSVTVIDLATNTIVDAIMVGTQPSDVGFSPDGTRLYVLTGYGPNGAGSLAVLDAATDVVLQRIAIDDADAYGRVAISPDGALAYVTKPNRNQIAVVNLASNAIVATIALDDTPQRVAMSSDGTLIYVMLQHRSNLGLSDSPYVAVLDATTGTTIKTTPNSYISYDFTIDGVVLWDGGIRAEIPAGCWGGIDTPTPEPTWTPQPTATQRFTAVPTAPRLPTKTPGAPPTVGATFEYVYVANWGADNVSVIDVATNGIVATVAVGLRPVDVAVAPDGLTAYVANSGSLDVSRIDTATNTVTATIPLGHSPAHIVAADGDLVYVGSGSASIVSVIDVYASAVVATIDLDESIVGSAAGMALSPDGGTLYVAASHPGPCWNNRPCYPNPWWGFDDSANAVVVVIDTRTRTVRATIQIPGSSATGLALSPDGASALVTHGGYTNGWSLSVIDTGTNSVTAARAIDAAAGVGLSANGSVLYLLTGDGVVAADSATLSPRVAIPTGRTPADVAFSSDGSHAYVTNTASYSVSVIDTGTNSVTATMPVRAQPQGIAVAAVPQRFLTPTPTATTTPPISQVCAYVVSYDGVSVINTATRRVTRLIAGGAFASGVAVSPDGRFVYATRSSWTDLAVIDTSSAEIAAEVPVVGSPTGLALTPDGTLAYVATQGGDNLRSIEVIDTRTRQQIAQIATGGYSGLLSIPQSGGRLYASKYVCDGDACENRLLVIDTTTQAVSADVRLFGAGEVRALTASPDGAFVYADAWIPFQGDNLAVIDTMQLAIVATVPLDEPYVESLSVSPDGRRVYVIGEHLLVIDSVTRAVVDSVPVSAFRMAFTPDGREAYLTTGAEATVFDLVSNTPVDGTWVGYWTSELAIGTTLNGCIDPDALTPRPTRTPTDTAPPTNTPTATRTATRTRTPLPTRPPTIAALISLDPVSGAPGERVNVTIRLQTMGQEVIGVQDDIAFDLGVPIAALDNGHPACTVNPAINKRATAFGFQPRGCRAGVDCSHVRAIIVGLDNLDPIPDEAVLYTCSIAIPANAAAGTYPLRLSNLSATDSRGSAIPVTGSDGTLVVQAPLQQHTCVGDCNGDGTVTIDEVMTCIPVATIAAIDLPPRCPACDGDGNGSIEVNELVAAVNNALNDCPSNR